MNFKFPLLTLLVLVQVKLCSQCFTLPNYCTPTFVNVNSFSIGLQNVTIGSGINNSTTATGLAPNYVDYTNLGTAAAAGASVSLSVTNGASNLTEARMYVDYNNDGTFSTSGAEAVWVTTNTAASAVVTGSFTIPSTQPAGIYRIRVTGDYQGQTVNPCALQYGEVEDYTLIVTGSTGDAVAIAHTSPTFFIAGNNTIGFSMRNLTSSTMTSVDIGYKLGSNTPVTESLSSLSIAPGGLYTATFSTSLNISSTGNYNLKTWLNNVNGAGTQTRQNDTICRNLTVYCGSALSGTYTINPSGSGSTNFKTIGAADTALKACGVSGPVVFNLSSATYQYQMDIQAISGVSSTNTVTFDGGNGNAASRILTFPTNASAPYVLRFNACSYVKFRNMTIRSTGTTDAWVVHFLNGTNNTVNNCIIEMTGTAATSTASTLAGVVVNGSAITMSTSSSTSNNNTIDSCTINAGYYSIFSVMSTVANILNVTRNTFNNPYFYGFNSNGNCSPKIIGNVFNMRNNNNGNQGIQIFNCNNTTTNFIEISNNKILNAGQYGINMSSCSHSGTVFNRIHNNMIGGGFRQNTSASGILMQSVNRAQVYHNSINMDVSAISGTTTALTIQNGSNNDVRNNHLVVSNSSSFNTFPLLLSSGTVLTNLDYNNYFSNSSINLVSIGGVYYTNKTFNAAFPTGGGVNSFNRNPAFVSGTDLHTINSCNSGFNLTSLVANDYDGNTRSSTPDIGADEVNSVPNNDIGVMKINSPGTPLTSGSKTVNVTLRNYGNNTVTSADIKYVMNGGSPVVQSWTGSLAPCDTVNFSFSTSATAVAGSNTLRVFTSIPNSSTDAQTKNDTAILTACSALNGTYTIGATGNYANFTAAVNALLCGGVSGPVKFNVAAGTYNEQIRITNINGASNTNQVVFQSATGNANDVSIVFNSSVTTSNYTVYLQNANFLRFNNMTIGAGGVSFGNALLITNNSSYDSFVNVTFNGLATTTNTTNLALINCPNGISDFMYFGNCRMNNGAYGSNFVSNTTLPSSQNLTFFKCVFTNNYVMGISNSGLAGIRMINNTLTTNSTLTTYRGISSTNILIPADINRPLITGNRVSGAVGGVGIFCQSLGLSSTVTTARRPLIANNFVQIGSGAVAAIGIRDISSSGSDYVHNSVNLGNTLNANTSVAGSFESSTAGNVIMNNSLVAYNGACAIRITSLGGYSTCDYNNLYTTGAILAYNNATSLATIADWRTSSSKDANSVNVIPYYTNVSNLHSNQSAMDNTGTPTSLVTTDIDNQPRCPNGSCPGATSNPDIGADEFIASALDAHVASVDAPTLICPGSSSYGVSITLKNLGSTTLTSATINWSVNGVSKTPFNWTGSIAQGSTSSGIAIGSTTFSGSNNVIKVWSGAPNGGTDGNNDNDTIYYTPSALLSGTYTIGGSSASFSNFTAAVNALNAAGICGPVIFNVRQGVYPEKIQLNSITGSSATNFITFRADPANTLPAEITANGNSAAADNHTIFLNGTRFIAFRGLRITNTSTGTGSFGSVIRFAGTQDSVLFIKNTITGPVTTSTSTNFAVINHGTGAANMINRCILDSNTISNGSYSIYMLGNTNTNATTYEFRNRIRHNQINGAYYRGIDCEYQRKTEIIGNRVWLTTNSQTSSYGVYMIYVDSFHVDRNSINNFGQYGLYVQAGNYQWGAGNYRATINNNMVGGRTTMGSSNGIYLAGSTPGTSFVNVFHNSVSVNSTATGSAFFLQQTSSGMYTDIDIRNNSFTNFGSGAYAAWFYFNTTTTIPNLVINYNNYYNAGNTLILVVSQSGYTTPTGGAPTYNNNSIGGIPGYANDKTNLHAVKTQLNDKAVLISSCGIDIDGQARPLSPSTAVDIGADEYHPVQQDISVVQFQPGNICNSPQALNIRVQNVGLKRVDSFKVGWKANGVLQAPMNIKTTLTAGNSTTVQVSPSFAMTNNTDYNFQFWTSLPNGFNDSVPDNDTLNYVFSFLGNAPAPTTVNTKQCGNGYASLSGIPFIPSDSISWYTAATGGKFLGIGKKIVGPYITGTTNFYAQGIRFGKAVRFGPVGSTNVNANTGVDYGGMLNVTPANTILLDSMLFRIVYTLPLNYYKLYYKTGTFAGFETNPSAWTLVNAGLATTLTLNGQQHARISAKNLFLQGGQTYSFYLASDVSYTASGNVIMSQNAGATVSNPDITVQGGGSIIIGTFGATQVLTNWHPEMTFVYKNQCANGPRAALTVTVKPRPMADIAKGSTFEGQFRSGDKIIPDVTEVGNTTVYEMVPPTGYNNSGHGSTWAITNFSVKTNNGYIVPPTEYTVDTPSASGPAKLTFKPSSAFLDSMVVFRVNFSDFGPNFCDSFLTRWIMVAPTPKTNFKFKDTLCLGESIVFQNLTTIHSGQTTFKWYFDDGDSSDVENPFHDYRTAGVYYVRLVALSHPWGVVKDTTLVLEVSEIPNIKYKVNNKCQGIPVEFVNQSTLSKGTMTYIWDFGDGSAKSTATSPTHLYSVAGGHKVTLTVTSSSGCAATLIKNAHQFARPVANFIPPSTAPCSNTEVSFNNSSTIAIGNVGSYWSFGDGASSTQTDAKHQYATAGTYDVKLLAVSEFDCKDSITRQVTTLISPVVDFVGNQFCSRIPTIFTNLTTESVPNPIYNWKFSDNFTSALKNVTRTWPNEGPFSATLSAKYTNGCQATLTKDFSVMIQPKAKFTVQDICSGESASFVNQTVGDRGGIQYFWDFGNGTNSSLPAPVALYNPVNTATYSVTLIASYPGACSDTVRKTITVSESPVCNFSIENHGFLEYTFKPAVGSYPSYQWFFGDGETSTTVSPTYKFKHIKFYSVTMVATNVAGCECTLTKTLEAKTSVDALAAAYGIKVYPNPNTGIFTVSNSGGSSMKVEVFDILGNKVYSESSESGELNVDLENAAKGVYLVKVTIDGVTSTTKISVLE